MQHCSSSLVVFFLLLFYCFLFFFYPFSIIPLCTCSVSLTHSFSLSLACSLARSLTLFFSFSPSLSFYYAVARMHMYTCIIRVYVRVSVYVTCNTWDTWKLFSLFCLSPSPSSPLFFPFVSSISFSSSFFFFFSLGDSKNSKTFLVLLLVRGEINDESRQSIAYGCAWNFPPRSFPLSLTLSLSLSSFLPSFLFKVLEVVVDGAVLLMESLEVFSCLFCFALSVFFRVIGDDDRGEGWIWDLRLDAESKIDRNFFFFRSSFFEERNIILKTWLRLKKILTSIRSKRIDFWVEIFSFSIDSGDDNFFFFF